MGGLGKPLRMAKHVFFLAAVVLGASACVGGSKGLSSEDKERLKPYMADSEPADLPTQIELNFETTTHTSENRAIAAKVKTGIAAPPPQEIHSNVPEITLGQKLAANEKITIDGKADEAAWKGAPVLGPFVDQGTGAANASFPTNGKVRLLWDDQNLYIFGELAEQDVVGGFDDKTKKVPAKDDKTDSAWTTGGQPKLWTKDALEVM